MKIAFMGGGNMGEAILGALLDKKLCQPADISVSDVSETRRNYLKKQYGITVTASSREAVKARDVVVLAVKPQNIDEVMADLKGFLKPAQLVLSIAAGVKISTIKQGLGQANIVRSMPNTPAQIGLGISGWTATAVVSGEQKAWVRTILGAMGKEICFDDEKYLDMVTAVSGSGPAYFYLFAESLIDAAGGLGLTRKDAGELVLQTMLGAAHLMQKSDITPAKLRRSVTWKAGTTERAIQVFEESGLAEIVSRAVKAACQRAGEMGET